MISLKPVEDEKYNVVRISKDGTVTKTILEDVKYILCMKEDVFYYVPSFSENQIYKIDRFSLKEEKYQVVLDEETAKKARLPLDRMLELGK